jgi:hypothetical protein
MEADSTNSPREWVSSLARVPRDLRVELYLKAGDSWPLKAVDSIDTSSSTLTVKSCIGLRMEVEPRCTVSNIDGIFDTVTLEAHYMCGMVFAATIVVPPGYSIRITDVEGVTVMDNKLSRTRVKTEQAMLVVLDGDYVVKRRNCHRSVLVESADIEC